MLSSLQIRYFTLNLGILSYYNDKTEAELLKDPLGCFHVLSITSIRTRPDKDARFSGQVRIRDI